MYAIRVDRGKGPMLSHEKGRQSALTASSCLKGSCGYCIKPSREQAHCYKFLRKSGAGPLPFRATREEAFVGVCKTLNLHNHAECGAQQQQRGNGGTSGYNCGNDNSGNGIRRRHSDGSNTGQANTVVTVNGMSSLTVIAPVSAAPVLPRLLQLSPRLLLRRTLSSHLHRSLATRSS